VVELSGENEMITSAIRDMVLMIVLAIIFIYLIMVAQFQSLLSPFIILFTLPLAFTGGLLLLWITGMELSITAILGFLVLAGIVVNNGIVFVDFANQLRLEGKDKREALIETGTARIRPILMTALTTILAMSTIALGIGRGAEMTQPMAVVTIGGLTYATFMTLLVVPVMYDYLHRRPLNIINIDEKVETNL
jgi:multidrug efflux pump subunit AcrB